MTSVALGTGDEEDGDVVAAAVGVGGVDEGVAGGFERGGGRPGEDAGDFRVVEFAGEAIGGEQVEVSGLRGVGGDVGLDDGLRAYGTGDDVADGRRGGLGATENAGADLLFDEGVVHGEELEGAVAEAVAAAVSDVGEPESVDAVPQEGDESGAHAVEALRFAGVAEDSLVGGADSLAGADVDLGGMRRG